MLTIRGALRAWGFSVKSERELELDRLWKDQPDAPDHVRMRLIYDRMAHAVVVRPSAPVTDEYIQEIEEKLVTKTIQRFVRGIGVTDRTDGGLMAFEEVINNFISGLARYKLANARVRMVSDSGVERARLRFSGGLHISYTLVPLDSEASNIQVIQIPDDL